MRLRKYFVPKSLAMITFRVEEGLPFVATQTMNALIWSALGRAQRLYPVKLVGFTMEQNHGHMFIYVEDPELVPKFIGYFKQETAHYLNRLLDRKKKTVWAEGYDSPVILDFTKALEMFAYGILNPVKDGLVAKMTEYPGVTSYEMLLSRQSAVKVADITRDSVTPLKNAYQPWKEDEQFLQELKKQNQGSVNIELDFAAMRFCFSETKNMSSEDFKLLIIKHLTDKEEFYRDQRKGKKILGRINLIRSSMLKAHQPPSKGKRMVCLSCFLELRKIVISKYKSLARKAEEVYQAWKAGKRSQEFPAGMFAPSLPRYANFLP